MKSFRKPIDIEKMAAIRWWHRIRLSPDVITPGLVVHGPDDGDWPTTRFGLPENLFGKTVLDIGCWDGFFCFESERRGAAKVVGIDVPVTRAGNWGGPAGFEFAKEALQSRSEFIECSLYDAHSLGEFDVVLCFGVLYHLTDVLGAVRALARVVAPGGYCLIETAIAPGVDCHLEYHPGFDNDPTNYFYPTIPCLSSMCVESGFLPPQIIWLSDMRATVLAVKRT